MGYVFEFRLKLFLSAKAVYEKLLGRNSLSVYVRFYILM